ncbi:MdpB Microcystin-dependent protein [uncultured Caudovirales phage]|uniref:MdpB Microcystin-dependent protein n=1 Tax=uncultured Caudovirales phage TaxID=2100421 RepID=A0A6J5LX93_9CAUD|nr:MdpB Microcystin-dependent protein [uncultured Caudovirales phage]
MSNARNISVAGSSAPGGLAPAGVVLPFAGTTAPTGWLLCFGQAVSRTTFATLFAALGTTYGAGNGTTTFALPDLRGRVAAGEDDMGGTAASRLTTAGSGVNGLVLGATGGAQTHTLGVTEMPAHTHGTGGDNLTVSAGGQSVRYGNNLTTLATSSTGGGLAHNNTQPTIVLNYIIKT